MRVRGRSLDTFLQEQGFRWRVGTVAVVVLLMFTLLLYRLYVLQVQRHEAFALRAETNRQAEHAGGGDHRADIDAQFPQHHHDRHRHDDDVGDPPHHRTERLGPFLPLALLARPDLFAAAMTMSVLVAK